MMIDQLICSSIQVFMTLIKYIPQVRTILSFRYFHIQWDVTIGYNIYAIPSKVDCLKLDTVFEWDINEI